jgi:hypothetical protein
MSPAGEETKDVLANTVPSGPQASLRHMPDAIMAEL